MTFIINGTDFSDLLQAYGYSTSYNPVYSQSVQTMDGYEHVGVLRYRGGLTVSLKPLTGTQLKNLTNALATGVPMVQYTCLQRNTTVLANMRLDNVSAELVLKNASRMLYGGTQLTFTEL
jgi:hypothetical protein